MSLVEFAGMILVVAWLAGIAGMLALFALGKRRVGRRRIRPRGNPADWKKRRRV